MQRALCALLRISASPQGLCTAYKFESSRRSFMHTHPVSLGRRSTLPLPRPFSTQSARPLALSTPATAAAAAAAAGNPSGSSNSSNSRRALHSRSVIKPAKGFAMDSEAPAAKKQRLELGRGAPAPPLAAAAAAAPAAAAEAPPEGGKLPSAENGAGPQQGKQGRKKKNKVLSPEGQARMDIQMAARDGDIARALAVYDRARAQGLRLGPDSYSTLLYLCSLGEDWEASVPKGSSTLCPVQGAQGSDGAPAAAAVAAAAAETSGNVASESHQREQRQRQQQQQPMEQRGKAGPGPASAAAEEGAAPGAPAALSPEGIMARGREIFEALRREGKDTSEMCYTALARMAAIAGDPAGAFRVVRDMQAAGVAPKLRSFTPALAGFAEQGEFAAAAEVDAAISGASLDLNEAEYARLLQAAAGPAPRGASWAQARSVLLRMGRELTLLARPTLDRAAAYFAAQQAQQALAGEQQEQQQPDGGAAAGRAEQQQQEEVRWEVLDCRVSRSGEVWPASGAGTGAPAIGRMRAIDLDESEWVAFREGIAALAANQEKRPNEFQKYLEWLEQHGPFGAVVDGANVALFGQNFEQGGFTFDQIRAVRNHLLARHPDLKPLVILHVGRTKAPQARAPEAKALLDEMCAAGQFFATPVGSNDDWYWIYAAVAAGGRGLLVSNDEMRDHIFQLLAPKFFAKWKQRHQVKYSFGGAGGGPQFEYPAPYTACVQELACGSWVLPAAEGPWLCARRVPPLQEAGEAAAAAAPGGAAPTEERQRLD